MMLTEDIMKKIEENENGGTFDKIKQYAKGGSSIAIPLVVVIVIIIGISLL